MRTNVVIDDDPMLEVLTATGFRTKREAIEGSSTLLRPNTQAGVGEPRGMIDWEGDLDTMRRDNIRP